MSNLFLSSNDALNSGLKDSLAAKAANKLLIKWHEQSPFATLQELEDMYSKFYEYYYDSNYGHNHHHNHHHHHHYGPHHYGPHHHHHHHHHLNLLDFLEKKKLK